jgi:GDP-L-fucose synthase
MRVTVTGGAGFLGTAVAREMRSRGWDVSVSRSAKYDLRTADGVRCLLESSRPDMVIHLAAAVGGIGANVANPGRFIYENSIMGLEMMEQSRIAGVQKFVTAGTCCEYPERAPLPLREWTIWDGYPAPDTAPYGIAKRLLLAQGQASRDQYGFNVIHLLPPNLYGPGDNLDPTMGHVVPALAQRFIRAARAGDRNVTCWGSGRATREFLYIDDVARGVALAAERYNGRDPVNIGIGVETRVATLAETIARACGFSGQILWDPSHPDGAPRRVLDVSRAKDFGFKAEIGLEEGISRTVSWLIGQL